MSDTNLQPMTEEQISQLAKFAGIDDWWDSGNEMREVLQEHLRKLVVLAVAHGRMLERRDVEALCSAQQKHYWKRAFMAESSGNMSAYDTFENKHAAISSLVHRIMEGEHVTQPPESEFKLICPTCKADRSKVDCQGDRMNCGLKCEAQGAVNG